MPTDAKAVKLSFHIPAAEYGIAELIQLICNATGTTPSSWVYAAVTQRLRNNGMIDSSNRIIPAEYKRLQAALPPGAERKVIPNAKHRSSKNSRATG
jgi:hypothetical protein